MGYPGLDMLPGKEALFYRRQFKQDCKYCTFGPFVFLCPFSLMQLNGDSHKSNGQQDTQHSYYSLLQECQKGFAVDLCGG